MMSCSREPRDRHVLDVYRFSATFEEELADARERFSPVMTALISGIAPPSLVCEEKGWPVAGA